MTIRSKNESFQMEVAFTKHKQLQEVIPKNLFKQSHTNLDKIIVPFLPVAKINEKIIQI